MPGQWQPLSREASGDNCALCDDFMKFGMVVDFDLTKRIGVGATPVLTVNVVLIKVINLHPYYLIKKMFKKFQMKCAYKMWYNGRL